jgi:serine/threonine-protein kinase
MIGKRIQNYEIKSHLGEGGMGTVYRASDSILNRDVALKMLHTPLLQQPLFLERFKKEARVLAQLLHPNIAVIYNMIEQDNNHFMVMEFVEGKNLDALLRQYKTLSYKIVVPVIFQALEGLGHAHKKNIFHRDIKPSNLILKSDGTVKLMDFGIAMVAGEQRMTQVNRVIGTVEYLAPELIQGKEPSIATDLYAMGVAMYELLTGKLPFEGNTDYNLMEDILKKKPLAVDKLNVSVPGALSDVVMKALEKNPKDRFKDAKQFQQTLANAFPEFKNAELTGNYITAAQQFSPALPQKRISKPAAIPGGKKISKPVEVYERLKGKVTAKENRLVVICGSVVLLTAIMAFIFMPRSSNIGKTDNSVMEQSSQQKELPKNKSNDNNEIPSHEINTQSTPVIIPAPVIVSGSSGEENTKKKKEQVKQTENEDQKKQEAKPKEEKENITGNNSETKQPVDTEKSTAKKDEDQDKKESNDKKKKRLTFEDLFGGKKKNDTSHKEKKKLRISFKKKD